MKSGLNGNRDRALDDLFQKSLEKVDIPYQEEDWKKMDTLLDMSGGKSILSNRALSILKKFTGLFLLLLGVGYIFLSTFNPIQNSILNSPDYLLTQLVPQDYSLMAPSYSEGNHLRQRPQSYRQSEKQETINSENFSEDKGFGNRNVELVLPMKRGQKTTDKSDIFSKKASSEAENNSSGSIKIYSILVPEQNLSLTASPIVTRNELEKKLSSSSLKNLISRYSFALILSPDLNGGGNSIRDVPGISAGLNFEYFIHKNFSMNLGVLYSQKKYSSEYSGQSGSSYYAYQLDADCSVLDIPINLRYYALNNPNLRIYVSSGISSYLMLSEAYQVDYGSGSPIKDYGYNIIGQNQHYFKVGNFSAGLEQKLTENWSLQVEPYIKIPMIGIGENAINFNSGGVWLGVKYRW